MMSIEALNWAFALPIRDKMKPVLLALANHVRRDGDGCYPSVRRLMLFSGCSERSVQRALKQLAAMGLVVVESERGRTNYYRLMMADSLVDNPLPREDHPRQTDTQPPPNCADTPVTMTGEGCHPDTLIITEPV